MSSVHGATGSGDSRTPRVSESKRVRAAVVKPAEARREFLRRVPAKTDDGLHLIASDAILMIVAKGLRLSVVTGDHEYSVLYRLKDLEARLDPSDFLRLSRGIIVNVNRVSHITSGTSGTSTVTLDNGQQLKMSRNQTGRLRQVLLAVLG
jgi:two-component system LytT family response regulator